MQDLQRRLLQAAATYGLTGLPRLTDRNFISRVVFDLRQTGGTPKAKLAYLFPNRDSAQIVIRLRPDLSDSERHRALGLIGEAVNDETPRKACAAGKQPAPCFALEGGSYVVSGAPVVIDGLAGMLEDALRVLFAAALLVMALTLLVVFRSRLRLLPLVLALAAAGITFGLLGAVGGSLTMASIAVLPVLIGLAVDYAIQLQARYDEAVEGGSRGESAARAAASRGGPVIGTACLATAAGFAVLQLSPSPMVRGFGLMLVVGIAVAFALALTAGFAALSMRREPGAGTARGRGPGTRWRAWRLPLRSSAGRLADPVRPLGPGGGDRRPGRVLVVGLVLALCGWVAGTRIETISDVRQLVPQDLAQVRDLNTLQDATGVSGEVDVSVQSRDIADPALVRWMGEFKQRVLEANGFEGASRAAARPGSARARRSPTSSARPGRRSPAPRSGA